MSIVICGKLYPPDTEIINVDEKYLYLIPAHVFELTNLQILNLFYNKIEKIPKEIQQLKKLERLNLFCNKIKVIPKEIKYLLQLQRLDLFDNKIKEIPIEIKYLSQLKQLYLSNNYLTEIPKEIQYLTQLQELYIANNKIKELPLEIINLRNLINFSYRDNPIENLLNPIIRRFIDRVENINNAVYNLYADGQNVHSSSIQQSIKDSIYNLIKQVKNNYKYNYLDDPVLNIQTKEALIEYSKDKEIHGQLDCTFEEVLDSVFLEINSLSNENQIEVKKRLNEEMEDGMCKCFTGRLSRLVNSLSGYSDKVSIKISSAEEIGNIISIIKDKYANINDVKNNVEKELLERGYDKDIITEWISYID